MFPRTDIYHVLKIRDSSGGIDYVTSRAKGTSPADALANLAQHESGQPRPLVSPGDKCIVLRSTESGTIANPNGAPSVFVVRRVDQPAFCAVQVSL